MAKILIVDDEPDVCRVLKKFLISQEHDVQVALNAKEALKSQAAFRPHLILLDIMMPGMTGIDALHHIKSEDPEVRVLMVSAVRDEHLARSAVQNGADDYVTKPVDLEYLSTSILVNYIQRMG